MSVIVHVSPEMPVFLGVRSISKALRCRRHHIRGTFWHLLAPFGTGPLARARSTPPSMECERKSEGHLDKWNIRLIIFGLSYFTRHWEHDRNVRKTPLPAGIVRFSEG